MFLFKSRNEFRCLLIIRKFRILKNIIGAGCINFEVFVFLNCFRNRIDYLADDCAVITRLLFECLR